MPVRWIPFIAFFLYVYIEISIFIQVAHVLGVLLTLILVIFTSVIGMSLVRNQGFKNFLLMQQKMKAINGIQRTGVSCVAGAFWPLSECVRDTRL